MPGILLRRQVLMWFSGLQPAFCILLVIISGPDLNVVSYFYEQRITFIQDSFQNSKI